MDESLDREAVTEVLSGNVNAYRDLVQRYQRPIFNLMYRLTGSREDARDLAQETFIKAYQNLEKFKLGARFFPWLYTIGLNHGRNFVRDHKRQKDSHVDMGENGIGMASFRVCNKNDADPLSLQRLREALRELPLEYREAVVLHFREGFSMKEIAVALDLSVSGAKMRVHRGLKRLRKMIDGEITEEEESEDERFQAAG
jgi:RNA polymerase sigma-70 factor (ECF subfamily)